MRSRALTRSLSTSISISLSLSLRSSYVLYVFFFSGMNCAVQLDYDARSRDAKDWVGLIYISSSVFSAPNSIKHRERRLTAAAAAAAAAACAPQSKGR